MIKLLPIVAFSLFVKEFKNLNTYEAKWYYKQQCAMKHMFGIKASIKFIKE